MKIVYNEKIGDDNLKITDKYIQYGTDVIPLSALSFFSLKKPSVKWWIPLALIIATIVVFCLKTPYNSETISMISLTLLIVSIISLIVVINKSQRRFLMFYSHSGQSIFIDINKDCQQIVNAVYCLLEDRYDTISETNNQ